MEREAGPVLEVKREARQIITAICFCFFFSGSTGLIYEVLWTRMLGLVFGHTVVAITTVLAAFMAGLGLGSFCFGRIADRHAHPVRLYGLLEVGIGLYAVLTPLLFSKAEAIYISLHRSLHLSFLAFSLSQFLLIFAILVIPATLMGATLPVLSRFFVQELTGLGRQVGRLYALNTFGAVLGAYAAGFHLIPIFGIRTSLWLAAVVNVGIGALAVVLDRHLLQLPALDRVSAAEPEVAPSQSDVPLPRLRDRGSVLGGWVAVIGLGLSGAASMMYEVAWTRALALVIGSSTYAFTTMLVTFLTGLALGSYLFSRWVGRLRVDPFLFGLLQLGIGLGALLVAPFFDRMPGLFLWVFRISQSPDFVKVLQFCLSALAMFLPTLFMGATFPCVTQIASRALDRVGHDVGRIYFINTGGAIVGTILAGFVLIPTWGMQSTLKLAISLNLLLALALFLIPSETKWRRGAVALAPFLALVVLFFSPPWDARAMTSGVAIYGPSYFGRIGKTGFRQAIASADQLVYYKDGISATVTLHRQKGLLYMRVNGKTDASNSDDMHTQLFSGHIPMLLHPNPKRVLVIGLGSGVTAGAVAGHQVERVDVIEIEPAVVEAAEFFAKENRNALKDPKVFVSIADGRNFLMAAEKKYDVVISEPSNPWLRGIGSLFSKEFYELAANHLGPDGVVLQWLQMYSLYPDDVRMVIKTFRSVFPNVMIWNTTPGDLLLVGSRKPLALDYSRLQSRYEAVPALRDDMARLGFRSPLTLLADFMLGEEDTATYSQHAWVNTDDLPILEFSAPDSLYADTVDSNRRLILAFRQREFPSIQGLPNGILTSAAFRRDLGLAFWDKMRPAEALYQFNQAVRADSKSAMTFLYRGRVHLRLNAPLKAEADFKTALQLDPKMAEAYEALGELYEQQKMLDAAEASLRKAVALKPKDPRYLMALADLCREQQRFDDAASYYLTAAEASPKNALLWFGLGLAYQGASRLDDALGAFRRSLAEAPENALAHYQAGRVYLEMKRFDDAATALQTAALKDSLKPGPHLELGRLYRLKGETSKALEAYSHALHLDPANVAAIKSIDELSSGAQ
jgi:spermidine synthase